MKKKELIKILETLVRKEVKHQMRYLLMKKKAFVSRSIEDEVSSLSNFQNKSTQQNPKRRFIKSTLKMNL